MDEMAQNIGIDEKVVNITAIKRQKKSDKPKVYESAVVDACIKWLWAQGCYVWRNNSGCLPDRHGRPVRYGLVGSADILGLNKQGRMVCIECKSDAGKLTDKQIEFGNKITANNGVYVVARSIDDLEAHKAEILGQKNLPTA